MSSQWIRTGGRPRVTFGRGSLDNTQTRDSGRDPRVTDADRRYNVGAPADNGNDARRGRGLTSQEQPISPDYASTPELRRDRHIDDGRARSERARLPGRPDELLICSPGKPAQRHDEGMGPAFAGSVTSRRNPPNRRSATTAPPLLRRGRAPAPRSCPAAASARRSGCRSSVERLRPRGHCAEAAPAACRAARNPTADEASAGLADPTEAEAPDLRSARSEAPSCRPPKRSTGCRSFRRRRELPRPPRRKRHCERSRCRTAPARRLEPRAPYRIEALFAGFRRLGGYARERLSIRRICRGLTRRRSDALRTGDALEPELESACLNRSARDAEPRRRGGEIASDLLRCRRRLGRVERVDGRVRRSLTRAWR